MLSTPSRSEIQPDALRACDELFALCESARLRYCVLRVSDADWHDSEIDLLVAPEQFDGFRRLAGALGFIAERTWGHAPHSFFSIVDRRSGRLVTLDVVTDLRYGRPVRMLRCGSAAEYLARRVPTSFGYALAPADEFRHLILHCALDKGEISPRHWQRLQTLAASLDKDPDVARQWVRHQRPLFWRLFRTAPIAGAWWWLSGMTARQLAPILHATAGRGVVVALLGPDGAGKSTLANRLAASSRRARRIYMGYGSDGGVHRNAAMTWLLDHARTPSGTDSRQSRRLSGALRFACRCAVQYGRALSIRMHRRLGRLVVLDRFVSEGEGRGGSARIRGRIIGALCPQPDLVVVLDAPTDVLHRRRPEHSVAELEARRASYQQLSRSFSGAVLADATLSADRLRDQVAARLWELRRPAQPRIA